MALNRPGVSPRYSDGSMAKFYVSSTTVDLAQARARVCATLRRMGHDVVSMEDYTAGNRPSLAECRADVEKCDYYIGLFAWRYGWEPADGPAPADNPDSRAITELEYRHAKKNNKTCFIFLLDEKASWRQDVVDDDKTKIRALRKMLSDETMPSLFSSEDDLVIKVNETLARRLTNTQPAAPSPVLVTRAREIKYDVAIFCSTTDATFAQAIAADLKAAGLKMPLPPMPAISADLFPPASAADFEKLEVRAREARSALVILSDAAVPQLPKDAILQPVVQTLEARTAKLVAFCRGPAALTAAAKWRRAQTLDATGWQDDGANKQLIDTLAQTIGNATPGSLLPTIGIPFIVFAMTSAEATAIEQNVKRIEDEVGSKAFEQFTALKESYEAMVNAAAAAPASSALVARYDAERENWKPFAGTDYTASNLIADVAQELNQRPVMLESRLIKPQLYPFDVLLDPNHPFLPVYEGIFRSGCVVLADEFSIFHPDLRPPLSALALRKGQIALVTISPLNPRLKVPFSGIEEELRRFLKAAITRFDQCDPQSEVMVADERRLKRWLYLSLPQTLRTLQNPAADPDRIDTVWQGSGIAPNPQSTAARHTESRVL